MNHKTLKTSLLAASLTLAGSVQATAGSDELQRQLDWMTYSVERSSISTVLNKDQRASKLAMLEKARQAIESGKLRTARQLLASVGRNLYQMKGAPDQWGHHDPQGWVQQRMALTRDLTREALRIARDRNYPLDLLASVEADRLAAGELAERGQWQQAIQRLDIAYQRVLVAIAQLRDGQTLAVSLPQPGTEAAWDDANRRYKEWRYMAQALADEMQREGGEANELQQAIADAEGIRMGATQYASVSDWQRAVSTMNQAFGRFEQSWRQVGLDI